MFALSVATDHNSKKKKKSLNTPYTCLTPYQWNFSSALSEMFEHSRWNYMIMKRNTYNLKEGMITQTTSSIIYDSMEKRKKTCIQNTNLR